MTAQDTGSRTEVDAGAYERHYAPDSYDDRPSASELARDAYEDDRPDRTADNACPECDDGIVVVSDRMEHDTGHYPYGCDRGCGFNG